MQLVQFLLVGAGFLLQVLLISTLWSGAYKKYPFLFAWALFALLGTLAEVAVVLELAKTGVTEQYNWVSELTAEMLTLATLVSMFWNALEGQRGRTKRVLSVVGALGLYLAFSAWVSWNPNQMTSFFRNMSFGCMLLTLALWLILLRHPNRPLLLICGGFGIQLAGTAIGHSLRYLSTYTVTAGNLMIMLSYLIGMSLFYIAVRVKAFPAPLARSHPECAIEADHLSV